MKKKWLLFITIIIIIVAVVLTIVFINLFTAKNTEELAQKVYSVTQNGYLNEDDEKNQEIDAYLDRMSTNSGLTSDQRTKITNYKNIYSAYEVIGEFFNRQIIFTTYTSVYKENRKAIRNSFDDAQEAVDLLYSYLQENLETVSGSDYWLAETWDDCEGYVVSIIENTIDAFTRLEVVYQSCVDSQILNNNMSTIIFTQIDRYTSIFADEENENYSTVGRNLLSFVNQYLTTNGETVILDYIYDIDGLKTKADDILTNGENSDYYNNFLSGRASLRNVAVVEV